MHAISTAHNLLAAMLDNHIYWGNKLGLDARRIAWRRVVDMNDRALRGIVANLGGVANGFPRETGYDITVASEVMAILCLANDLDDMQARFARIVVGETGDRQPVTAADLNADGAMTVLMKDAMAPNLAQSLEGTPAFVHGGPFANIAHGCNSVVATKTALGLGDYVVTEAGFGADLGAEKFLDIKCPSSGLANLGRHLDNMAKFGVPAVVAINRFTLDTDAELDAIRKYCLNRRQPVAVCTHWADGGAGAESLARLVSEAADSGKAEFKPIYAPERPLLEKIETVASEIYRADGVDISSSAKTRLQTLQDRGYGNLPVCMAKTQYSFSGDPSLKGAPTGYEIPVRDIRLSAGAGFVVVICGDIMTMPGLPRTPAAEAINIGDDGETVGLF